MDCTECPNEQENKVFKLQFAEVVAALQILSTGGTFVLKMFTFFELTTVSLLYFLINVFDQVDIFKPAASKQGNSEVYVICSGYHRTYENINYVLTMANQMSDIEIPIFGLDMIPKDFIKQVSRCAKKMMQFQTRAIQSNIYYFENPDCDQQRIHDLRYEIANEYCRVYGIYSIPDSMTLTSGKLCYGQHLYTSRSMFKNIENFSGVQRHYNTNQRNMNGKQDQVLMTLVERLVEEKLRDFYAGQNFACTKKEKCFCCDYYQSRKYSDIDY